MTESLVEPFPNSPLVFRPQQYALPLEFMAQVLDAPADIEEKLGPAARSIRGTTSIDLDGIDEPIELLAETEKVYGVPLTSPVITHDNALVVTHLLPPGVAVTV